VTGSASVAWLSIAPVKALRVQEVAEIELDEHGARGDRRFVITDSRSHLFNGKSLGALVQVVAECAPPYTALTLRFPDGRIVSGDVDLGVPRTMVAYGAQRVVRPVIGPWSDALSAWAGTELRVVQPVKASDGVDRRRQGGVTLLSSGSVNALATAATLPRVDRRRFRMTIGVDGPTAFAEEAWIGHVVEIGDDASVRVSGNVGRCAVTTQDPTDGGVDLRTLHLLRDLREGVRSTEPLPFGVWGEVVTGGRVRVGDAVRLLG
jgi:MOSC domain-containing protein